MDFYKSLDQFRDCAGRPEKEGFLISKDQVSHLAGSPRTDGLDPKFGEAMVIFRKYYTRSAAQMNLIFTNFYQNRVQVCKNT